MVPRASSTGNNQPTQAGEQVVAAAAAAVAWASDRVILVAVPAGRAAESEQMEPESEQACEALRWGVVRVELESVEELLASVPTLSLYGTA